MRRLILLSLNVVALYIVTASLPAFATTIQFNDRDGLANVRCTGGVDDPCAMARFFFANNYRESGMLFIDGVNPRDPNLGGGAQLAEGHFHLNYQDPAINIPTNQFVAKVTAPGFDPTTKDRTISPHEAEAVIQMTFDPNRDGVLHPFSLRSIDVIRGALNVGICFGATLPCSTSDVAIYNNLTAAGPGRAQTWGLIGGDNIIRATLEGLGPDVFEVDNIVFEGATPSPMPVSGALRLDTFDRTPGFSSELHDEVLAQIPEPTTLLLFGTTMAGLGLAARWRRHKQS